MDPTKLAELMRLHPMRELMDAAGNPKGQIITCPVRLDWIGVDKFHGNKKFPSRPPEASVSMIVPPSADVSALDRACKRVAAAHFGETLNHQIAVTNPVDGSTVSVPLSRKLRFPQKPQTPGKPGQSADGSGIRLRAGSKGFLPTVIDSARRPIPNDDPALYAGMWAIVLLNVFPYPKARPASWSAETIFGVGLGLLQIQKIGDDAKLAAGGYGDAFADLSGIVGASAAAPMLNGSGATAGANIPDAQGINWG